MLNLLLLTSCLSTKKISDKETSVKQISNTETQKDSTKKETVNKAIRDTITVSIPYTDPVLAKQIDDILLKLNTQKTSGDNSYKLYYDKELRELKAAIEVAETKDTETATNTNTNTESSFEMETKEKVKKVITMLPWWVWLIVAWLLRKQIIGIIAIFFPGVRAITSIHDLLNAPNQNKNDQL